MNLADELKQIWSDFERRGDPNRVQAYRDGLAQLLGMSLASDGVQVGQQMPPFLLPSVDGRLVSSADLLAKGPLVVNFFRGEWCPFCRSALMAMRDAMPSIAPTGASLVAITPDTGQSAADAKRKIETPFDVLSDADGGVSLAFGILFRLPTPLADAYRKGGPALPQRHGNDAWTLPVPATFVADRSGTIRYRHVDPDFRNRADPQEVLTALRSLPPVPSGS